MTRMHMGILGGFVGGVVATKLYMHFMAVRAANMAAAGANPTAPIRANSSQVGVTN